MYFISTEYQLIGIYEEHNLKMNCQQGWTRQTRVTSDFLLFLHFLFEMAEY